MRNSFWTIIVLFLFLFPAQMHAQNSTRENQQQTCSIILEGKPAAAECKKIFPKKGNCCIQYDEKSLAQLCSKMSNIDSALSCFTEIHEVGFWKTDLLPEYAPGLGSQVAEQWKKNVLNTCSSEATVTLALDCAILQKSGSKFIFQQQNTALKSNESAKDPIFQFCRKAFGDYWEGVEECIKAQKAAKKRLEE